MRTGRIISGVAICGLSALLLAPAFGQFPGGGGKNPFGGGGGNPFGGGSNPFGGGRFGGGGGNPFGGGGGNPFGGGGFSGGGFSGGGMMGDPSRMFDMLARGRPYFLISETSRLAGPLNDYAKDHGITNGQITRDQFTQFSEQLKTKITSAASATTGGANPFAGGNKFGGAGGMQGASMSPGGGAGGFPGGFGRRDSYEMMNRMADDEFRRRDQNGDGYLNLDEMPDGIKNELARWDINHDNLIDINEHRAYYLARLSGEAEKGNAVTIILEEDFDKRPTVLRAGKLPRELKWFEELDIDKDGQIAMWEWRRAGKDLDSFADYDRNEDGFITPEEALRVMHAHAGSSGRQESEDGDGETVVRTSNAGPSFNRGNPEGVAPRMGKGNFDPSKFDMSKFDMSKFKGGGGKKGGNKKGNFGGGR